ncbi:unnamed protein product [Fraxinus pennsylvanica]|uniref:Ankyrin repeat-containing protein BDA1-like n=1 Tax=Fraxinus pennsylvanica TaxID=56036 RepID=A0AAD2A5X6_9LAMI|nr:unnamed protein product [Fraxinus pennsylvanica]
MEKKLSEASLQGKVELLHQILEEDPLILDKIIVLCISQTPLHTASMLGHLNFVKELLNRKPELAAELDSNGCSPLHLAAAKGHVDIVKELLSADSEVGFVRNLDGRTALHVAVIKGRAAAATELVRVVPELSRVLTDRGETCLHLCVKYIRVEMLQNLAEAMKKLDGDLVNWKDCDGNSILHIAVAKKQIEIIDSLLELNGLEMNALNKNGLTALDILNQSPRDLRDMEIHNSLQNARASSVKDLHLIREDWIPEKVRQNATRLSSLQSNARLSSLQSNAKKPVVKPKHTDWLVDLLCGGVRRFSMVVERCLALSVVPIALFLGSPLFRCFHCGGWVAVGTSALSVVDGKFCGGCEVVRWLGILSV